MYSNKAKFKEGAFKIRCQEPDTGKQFWASIPGYVSTCGTFGISKYEIVAGRKEPVETSEYKVTHIPSGMFMGDRGFVLLTVAVKFAFSIMNLADWKNTDIEILRNDETLIRRVYEVQKAFSSVAVQANFLRAA